MAQAVALLLVVAFASWWLARRSAGSTIILGSAKVTKLTYYPGEETDPAISPDGRRVAFSWNGGQGNPSIYVMSLSERKPIRLTEDPGNDISPSWSPDGKQIAFLRLTQIASGNLMVVPASGGKDRVIREVLIRDDIYRFMRPLLTWTPDGTGIVYTSRDDQSGRASLYLADLDGTSARQLFAAEEGSAGAAAPAFSPNGKWLAYTLVFGPYAARLYVRPVSAGVRIEGEAMLITGLNTARITYPVWTPGSTHLLFMQDSAIVDWDGTGNGKQLYAGAGFAGMSITWQPDRKMTAVMADQDSAELRAIPLRAGGLAAAGPDVLFIPYTGQSAPMFSPDGKIVLFHGARTGADEVWVANSDGGNPRQLTHLNPVTMGFPEWSPDGERIAFHARIGSLPQIYVLDSYRMLGAGSSSMPDVAPNRITDSAFGFYSPTWSADGKYIYANRANGGPRMFRIATDGKGTPEDLFEGVSARVTPDGHRIVYGKDGRLGIFSRSLDGDPATNAEEKLVGDYRPPGADLNPVASGIYYIGWDGAGKPRIARFYSYAQKKSVDVAVLSGRIPDVPGMAVSPDRRSLLYSQFAMTGKDLTLIEFQ
jgi:Tol biopolymer transport system component